MKERIVITGVAGFIGSNLADYLLSEGYYVLGIDNLSYGLKEQIPEGVEFHHLDIRSPDLVKFLKEGDVVFHLAAKNCISDCQNEPFDTADVNVSGTVNVFLAACKAGVKKVIYAESSALYEGSSVFPTTENDVSPVSFYSVSKWAGMKFAEAFQRFYGLNTTALRYFCVYGPRQDYRRSVPPVMSAFIINLLRQQTPTIFGTGSKKRDFIYVDDVNRFHSLCIHDSRTDGKVFNVGSGVNYSINEIYDTISGLLKSEIKPIYKNNMPGEAELTLANINEAKKMGWSPQVSLEEGLAKSIEYIKGVIC